MLKENEATLEKFVLERRLNGLSAGTLKGYGFVLDHLDKFLSKPFIEASKEDMKRFVGSMLERYKTGTIHLYKARVKAFFAWLFECDYREYPACVKWIRVNNPGDRFKSGGAKLPLDPEDILTPAEVLKLIDVSANPRNQALIATLYETAGRSKEVLAMKIKSVRIGQPISHITLKGETGKRNLPVKNCISYILAWLNVHPQRKDREAPLWWARQGRNRNIGYHTLRKLLKDSKKKAGIQKDVRAHLLRHSRLTELAKYLPEQKLKTWAGWTAGSNMASRYVHLSGKDLDDDFRKLQGLPVEKIGPALKGPLSPQDCPRCKNECPPTAIYCFVCAQRLDEGLYETEIQERDLWLNTYHEVLMERYTEKKGLEPSFYEIMEEVEKRILAKKRGEKA